MGSVPKGCDLTQKQLCTSIGLIGSRNLALVVIEGSAVFGASPNLGIGSYKLLLFPTTLHAVHRHLNARVSM